MPTMKYARKTKSEAGPLPYNRLIKIGFDARSLMDEASRKKEYHPKPGKLRGFLICKNDKADTDYAVDMEAMRNVMPGITDETILHAKEQQLRAPAGILPTELRFVIRANAVRQADDSWDFPGTFHHRHACWDGGIKKLPIPFCTGDGDKAMRVEIVDGQITKREIVCNPVLKPGLKAHEVCEFSAAGKCPARLQVVLCLFAPDADGKPQPLVRNLGLGGKFLLATNGAHSPDELLAELTYAANELDGNIAGITGTISWGLPKTRHEPKGDKDSGVGLSPRVSFALDPDSIERRKIQRHRMQLEDRRMSILESAPASERRQIAAEIGPVTIPQQDQLGGDTPVDAAYQEREAAPEPDEHNTPAPPRAAAPMHDDRNAPQQEQPRDVSAGSYGKASAQKSGNVTVADATPEELVQALSMYCGELKKETGQDYNRIVEDITDGRIEQGQLTQFLEDSREHPRASRIATLRKICAGIEAQNDFRFSVYRQEAAHAGS